MKKFTVLLGTAFLALSVSAANAAERPDVYVVKFRADNCQQCVQLDSQLHNAMSMVNSPRVEEVTIDSSNGLKWEVSAHTAFDRNIVPQFNKWVGLTGFVAVIDRETRQTIGCVDSKDDTYKMANFIKSAVQLPHETAVSNRNGQFSCPPTFNVDLGE